MSRQVNAAALNAQVYLSRTAALLACVCALAALLYSIFLLEAVAHAASQTAAQRRIGQLSAQLGDLEAQYLSSAQALTPQKAAALGFVQPSEVTTVFATAATRALSLRGQ